MADRAVQQTALGPMVIAASEQYEPPGRRVVDDPLALAMLPAGLRIAVRAMRPAPVRRLMINSSERSVPGSWGSLLGRKRYADDAVQTAVQSRIDQVVFLGAGFDTRAARLVVPAGASAYEVDLPDNTAAKRVRLDHALGRVPDRLHLTPIDFARDDLLQTLRDAGFDPERPALYVWEAVTQYLSEAAVRATLRSLSAAATGSRLIMTYVLADFLRGDDRHGADALYRRFVINNPIWQYGIDPDHLPQLLAEYGWTLSEDVGAADYRTRYLEPAGRDLPVMTIERFAAATRG